MSAVLNPRKTIFSGQCRYTIGIMYRGSQIGLFESTCLIIKIYILAIFSVYADQYLTTYYNSFLRATCISKSMLYNDVCFFLVILLIKNKI